MERIQRVAAHGLLKNTEGKYLITHRSPVNDWKPNEYDIPGGTIEFGEQPEEALVREFLEETGLKVRVGIPVHVYTSMSGPDRHQFQIVYECEYVSGEIKLNPEEHDEYKYVTKEEMVNLPLIAFLKSLSDNYLNKNNG